jgi:predicted ferric reductase
VPQGTSALVLLVVLSIPSLRRRSYELFLRLHQLLAVVFAASAVYHVFSVSDLYQRPVYIFGGICGLSLLTQAALLLYRNYVHGKPWPRIQVEYDNDTLRATLRLPRPVRVDAGQYINLWVPSRAWLSSHPFTVTSWSPVAQDSMDLIIEPRRGFTNKLRQLSQYGQNQYLAFFSGPHGTALPVLEYQTVILVATNFGLVWMRPYIKKLFNDYELGNRFRRRVRLVWHLDLQGRPTRLR